MSWHVDHGECLAVLRQAAPESVDSVVTDPPAGIDFMGRDWDCFRRRHNPADVGRDNLFGRASAAAPHSYGESDRGNFIAFMTQVMQECLRVLKPGGHALVWALPRTSHWTATAIEDAGFEIRTVLHHHFGSGFPKSLDVGKAIDKQAGAAREVVGIKPGHGEFAGRTTKGHIDFKGGTEGFDRPWMHDEDARSRYHQQTAPATENAKAWDGWGTAIKPATEHWILARKPLGEKNVATNVLKHGTGALNIGASRVGRAADDVPGWHKSGSYGREGGYCPTTCVICEGTTHALCFSDGVRMDKPGEGPCWNCGGVGTLPSSTFKIRDMPPEEVQARCGDKGRWPPDLLLSHSAECEFLGHRPNPSPGGGKVVRKASLGDTEAGWGMRGDEDAGEKPSDPMIPVWECVPGCPVAELDRQSGIRRNGGRNDHKRREPESTVGFGTGSATNYAGDVGGASRFFPTFHYIPKPSRREREAGLEKEPNRTLNRVNPGGLEDDPRWAPVQVKNHHPTVKSKALMDWLIRLITPPQGLVLDPFTGSGSTGVAAVAGGFSFWGIEQNEEYHRIAEKRIAFARAERSGQLSLFDEEDDE